MWHARVFGGFAVLALGIAVIFFSRQLPYRFGLWSGPRVFAYVDWLRARRLRYRRDRAGASCGQHEGIILPAENPDGSQGPSGYCDHLSLFPASGFFCRIWSLHLRHDAIDRRTSVDYVRGCSDRDSGEHPFSVRSLAGHPAPDRPGRVVRDYLRAAMASEGETPPSDGTVNRVQVQGNTHGTLSQSL